jgi:hypothetical protein
MINKSHSDHTSEFGDRLDRMMYTIETLKIKEEEDALQKRRCCTPQHVYLTLGKVQQRLF